MNLVIGATGNVGRPLVDFLLGAGEPVRAMSRIPAAARLPDGVDVREGDLSRLETLTPLFEDVDNLYLMFKNTGDRSHVANLCSALEKSKAQRVVFLSSLSVESNIPGDVIGSHHRDAEKLLADRGREMFFLRPGTFMSNSLGLAAQTKNGNLVRWMYQHPAAVIDERDIAEIACGLMTGKISAENTVALTGAEKTDTADRVRLIGEIIGRPLHFEPFTTEETLAFLMKTLPHADAAAVIESVTTATVPWAEPRPNAAELLGRPPGDFRNWVARNADRFR